MPRICPLNSGERSMFARTRSRTRSLVWSRWQSICARLDPTARETRTGPADRRRARPRTCRRHAARRNRCLRDRAAAACRSSDDPIEAERLERLGEVARRRFAGATGRVLLRADVNQAVEKRAGRDRRARGSERVAVLERQTDDAAVLDEDAPGAADQPLDVRLRLERALAPSRRRFFCRPARAATRPPGRGCD